MIQIIGFVCRGNAFSDFQEYKAALSSYDKSLELKPDDYATWYRRSLVLLALGNHDEAVGSFRNLLEQEPDNQEVWYWWSAVLKNLQNYEEAITWCEKVVEEQPDNYEAWYQLGKIYTAGGSYEKAIESHRQALKISPPGRAEIWNDLAHAQYFLGQWELMLESCDKTIELQPNFAGALHNRGIALINLNRLEEALASFDKAIEAKSNYYEAWIVKGAILVVLNQFAQVAQSYKEAIRLQPHDAQILYLHAWCRTCSDKSTQPGSWEFEKSLKNKTRPL